MSTQTLDHTSVARFLGTGRRRYVLLLVLMLAAAVSTSVAIKEALIGGIDFQWSAAHILHAGRDPWKTYLSGDRGHEIILGQQPNYLAEMYELLLPLGAMQFSRALVWWCGLNLLMLGVTLAMVGRLFRLDAYNTALAALLMLCATPFRVTMSNGQHGIFILFLLTCYYYLSHFALKGFALGLSYSKYSFSPLFVLVALMRRRWALFLVSLVPPSIGLFLAWRILGGNLLALAMEPLKTSRIAMGPGHADIMTPAELLLRYAHASSGLTYLLPTLLGLGVAIVTALVLSRFSFNTETEYTLVTLFTLLCFKHVLYDYVVLVVPLAFLLTSARSRARLLGLMAIGYFWYASSVINRFRPGLHLDTALVNFAVLCVLCVAVASLSRSRVAAKRHTGSDEELANSTVTESATYIGDAGERTVV